eukprot:scaffold648427_cov177-Attheya_sp.AAC.1
MIGSIDGDILTLGLILGTEEGPTDTDGEYEGPLERSILCVDESLGFSLGDTDSVGNILSLNDGPLDAE